MNRGLKTLAFFGFILAVLVSFSFTDGGGKKKEKKRKMDVENAQCLKCHGGSTFEILSPDSSRTIKQSMCSEKYIDTSMFVSSVHWMFKCTDCHSEDYIQFPHPLKGRFETMYTCLDCHGGDDNFAKFHFEDIDAEYQKSVHAIALKDGFSCWKCHDPHFYQNITRDSTKTIQEIVVHENNSCLTCHGNVDKFSLLSNKKLDNVIPNHDWLPNQTEHFKNVRCIDCHADLNDSVMVGHNILPSKSAVNTCEACHSKNSRLLASLYKFRIKENRRELGFFNSSVLNDQYIIGANRNYYLNIASVIIFSLVLFGILLHAILRIIYSRKHVK